MNKQLVSATLMLLATSNLTATELNGDGYQAHMLYNPSTSQIKREQKGSIYIYDGMTDKQVHRALDQQWERIHAMMFVNTIVTDDSGNPATDPLTWKMRLLKINFVSK